MNIIKTFNKHRDKESISKIIYGINIVVKNEKTLQNVFIDTSKMFESGTMWIDINKFNSEEFLNEHKIDYILEGEDKNIIPIGLVDFTKPKEYCFNELNIWNRKEIELYKSNQVLENIVRAIQIKYEAVKFINRFSDNLEKTNIEVEELDIK